MLSKALSTQFVHIRPAPWQSHILKLDQIVRTTIQPPSQGNSRREISGHHHRRGQNRERSPRHIETKSTPLPRLLVYPCDPLSLPRQIMADVDHPATQSPPTPDGTNGKFHRPISANGLAHASSAAAPSAVFLEPRYGRFGSPSPATKCGCICPPLANASRTQLGYSECFIRSMLLQHTITP